MAVAYTKSSAQSYQGVGVTANEAVPSPLANYVPYAWTDVLNGTKSRNWREKVRVCTSAGTNLSATEMTVSHSDADLYRKARRNSDGKIFFRSAAGYIIDEADPPGGDATSISSSLAQRDASNQFYRSCRSAQKSLDSGVLIGEIGETLRMIRGRGGSLMNLFPSWRNRLKKRRRKDHRSLQQHAADAWLEFQYGWKPLASDIGGALDAFHMPRRETKVCSGFGKSSGYVARSSSTGGSSVGTYYVTSVETTEARVFIKGAVKVQAAGVGSLRQNLGLAPQDFIPTVYNLLPWTFLIDYFTDLGSCIEAFCFPQKDIAWGSTTAVKRRIKTWQAGPHSPLLSGFTELERRDQPQITTWIKKNVVRTPGKPDIPWPVVRWPPSLTKWTNVAALAISNDWRPTRF